jgi:hypothetical protein
MTKLILRMSDAGDNVEVEAEVAEAPEVSEAPKGKLSVEEALEVHINNTQFNISS